jgi:hypothetical protein
VIKKWIKWWLGIKNLEDEIRAAKVLVGMDIGFKEQSWIIIASHLGGGQISITPTHFKNYSEFERVSRRLRFDYGKQTRIHDGSVGFVD